MKMMALHLIEHGTHILTSLKSLNLKTAFGQDTVNLDLVVVFGGTNGQRQPFDISVHKSLTTETVLLTPSDEENTSTRTCRTLRKIVEMVAEYFIKFRCITRSESRTSE